MKPNCLTPNFDQFLNLKTKTFYSLFWQTFFWHVMKYWTFYHNPFGIFKHFLGNTSGLDCISHLLLKHTLTKLFNVSLPFGNSHEQWKTALVLSLSKNGDNQLTSNYRPIALSCTTSKVFGRVIFKHIFNFSWIIIFFFCFSLVSHLAIPPFTSLLRYITEFVMH